MYAIVDNDIPTSIRNYITWGGGQPKDILRSVAVGTSLLILNTKVNKNLMFKKLLKTKKLFSKSLSLKENLKKNQKIKESNIILKKPGTGIQYKYLKKILNKKAKKDLSKFNILNYGDFY